MLKNLLLSLLFRGLNFAEESFIQLLTILLSSYNLCSTIIQLLLAVYSNFDCLSFDNIVSRESSYCQRLYVVLKSWGLAGVFQCQCLSAIILHWISCQFRNSRHILKYMRITFDKTLTTYWLYNIFSFLPTS